MGRITARLRDKGQDYGDFWGARATGSSSRLDELTWFIRRVPHPQQHVIDKLISCPHSCHPDRACTSFMLCQETFLGGISQQSGLAVDKPL